MRLGTIELFAWDAPVLMLDLLLVVKFVSPFLRDAERVEEEWWNCECCLGWL